MAGVVGKTRVCVEIVYGEVWHIMQATTSANNILKRLQLGTARGKVRGLRGRRCAIACKDNFKYSAAFLLKKWCVSWERLGTCHATGCVRSQPELVGWHAVDSGIVYVVGETN